MKDAILLTFAQSDDAHLDLLKAESKSLNWVLSSLHDKGAVEVYREESATTAEVIAAFNRFNDRIVVFHYAGHAGGEGLGLEGGDANAGGLAKLLRQQAGKLALVFLNGCSTLPQVDRLMDLGVKAVIATSSPVQDSKAKDFAEWFYQALGTHRTLQSAFEFAAAALQTQYKDVPEPLIVEYRSFKLREEKPAEFPWGLYINEAHRDILQWRLPETPRPEATFQRVDGYEPNVYLFSILEAMIHFKPALEKSLTDERGEPIDEREYLDIVIKNFPWTIGAQLQKLVSYSDTVSTAGTPRLEQIVSTYVITSQMLVYLLISQLWDRAADGEVHDWSSVGEVLALDKESFRVFDYLGRVKQLAPFFGDQAPFIAEFQDMFRELEDHESALFKAYLYLEAMKEGLHNGSLSAPEAAACCEDAEYCLALLLSRIAFLVNYQIVAVRDISLIYHRHSEVQYQHKLGELNAYDEKRLGLRHTPLTTGEFTNCNSVVLVHDLQRLHEFVSLSPFIIDKNTFEDAARDALNIYIFAYRENDEYVFHNVNTNIYNAEQNMAGQISTGFEVRKEIKSAISVLKGIQGIRKTESLKPFGLLREQFDNLLTTFNAARS